MGSGKSLLHWFAALAILLASGLQVVDAAVCASGDVTSVSGVTLDECYTDTFTVNGSTKTLTVHYTTTNGNIADRLRDLDTDFDGVDDLSDEEIAELVWDWSTEAWTVYGSSSYDFPDPVNLNDFHVYVYDYPALGGCCASQIMKVDAQHVLGSLLANDMVVQSTCHHEMFHAVSMYAAGYPFGSLPNWLVEGAASWSGDKVNRDLDLSTASNTYWRRVDSYFGGTYKTSLPDLSYRASPFWTYFTEQAGSNTIPEPEFGLDMMSEYWYGGGVDLVSVDLMARVEDLLPAADTRSFETFVADWGTANYVHGLGNLPDEFRYIDAEEMAPGGYPALADLALDEALTVSDSFSGSVAVNTWSHEYFKFNPVASLIRFINIDVQQTTNNKVIYTLLLIKGGDLDSYVRLEDSRHFLRTVENDDYDEIGLVISSMQDLINLDYAINVVDPVLEIKQPTTTTNVGDPAAPNKFILVVEINDPFTGTRAPIVGLDPSDFVITVGTETVDPAVEIVTAYYDGGLYWLVVRAPEQPLGAGIVGIGLDLTVSYGALSDTESGIIYYLADTLSDSVVTVDRSGSMQDNGKMESAKKAAKLYVDSYEGRDQLAVVSYAGSATVDVAMGVYGSVRDEAMTAIDALVASGLTSIGGALTQSLNELDANGFHDSQWSIVLLTDGLNTAGDDLSDFEAVWLARDALIGQCDASSVAGCVPKVHTIAVGPDANRVELKAFSDLTGGTHQYAAEPGARRLLRTSEGVRELQVTEEDLALELAKIYRVVSEKEEGTFQVNAMIDEFAPYLETKTFEFVVDSLADRLTVVLFWPDFCYDAELYLTTKLLQPNGVEVTGAIFAENENYRVWKVENPSPGLWKLEIIDEIGCFFSTKSPGPFRSLVQQPNSNGKFLAEASVSSALTLSTSVAEEDPTLPGEPVIIRAILTAGLTLPGSISVEAKVISPTGESWTVLLFDDGQHNDGGAGDGVFAGLFPRTSDPGSYQVSWTATGPDFSRTDQASFAVAEALDSDGDGMPDRYEEKHPCLDPNRDDASEDADLDGLSNLEEWELGTDPCDADTDNGGESDGSEASGGRNPLDGLDDAAPVLRYLTATNVAEGGEEGDCSSAQAAILHYGAGPLIDRIILWKATSEDGPRTEVSSSLSPTGSYTDSAVTLGQKYCYWIAAASAGGLISNTLGPACTIPLNDPLCLTSVTINDSAGVTDAPDDVIVKIGATGASEMIVTNALPFGDTWEPFAASVPNWSLNPVDGLGTVYVKVRGFDDRVDEDSATIAISTTVDLCAGVNCVNGQCKPGSGTCDCDAGWTGTDCSTPTTDPCVGVNCVNGQCDANGTCNCDAGWTGTDCSTPTTGDPCAGVNCVNGQCDGGTCDCDAGWTGTDCSTPLTGDPCAGVICVNGQCVDGTCNCEDGWTGTECDEEEKIETTGTPCNFFTWILQVLLGWLGFYFCDL